MFIIQWMTNNRIATMCHHVTSVTSVLPARKSCWNIRPASTLTVGKCATSAGPASLAAVPWNGIRTESTWEWNILAISVTIEQRTKAVWDATNSVYIWILNIHVRCAVSSTCTCARCRGTFATCTQRRRRQSLVTPVSFRPWMPRPWLGTSTMPTRKTGQ